MTDTAINPAMRLVCDDGEFESDGVRIVTGFSVGAGVTVVEITVGKSKKCLYTVVSLTTMATYMGIIIAYIGMARNDVIRFLSFKTHKLTG